MKYFFHVLYLFSYIKTLLTVSDTVFEENSKPVNKLKVYPVHTDRMYSISLN